jgi:hypothetical protein
MILWLRRGAAVGTFMLLMPLSFTCGHLGVAFIAGIVNFGWAIAEQSPSLVQRLLAPCMLIVNTIASTYAVLCGGSVTWAILVSGASLVSWNAGLFGQRCPNASLSTQYRYLRRVGGMFALGTGTGMSALILQGHFEPPFVLAFFIMLTAGFLCLRLISQASLQRWEEK